MQVNYTIEIKDNHIHVGKLADGRTMAVSMKDGVKAASFNPLAAITAVIGVVTPAMRRELLRVVADRV